MRWSSSRPARRQPSWHRYRSVGYGASGHRPGRRWPTTAWPPSASSLPCPRARCDAASASTERSCTFDHDVTDPARLEATLLDLAESVASRLRRQHLAAGGVQLKLRYEGFDTITRQAPLGHQVRESEPIYELGVRLLRKALAPERAVRLIGLTAIHLSEAQQLTLFDAPEHNDRITQSIDAVRKRFGDSAITRARLVGHRDRRRPDFGMRPEAPPDDPEP